MAWIQVSVAEKNDNAFVKTLLLNTTKFGSIETSGSVAVFYYADYSRKTSKYKTTSLTKDQLIALVTDTSQVYDNRVELPVLGKSPVKRNKLNDLDLFDSVTAINVEIDNLIDAWDITGTDTCYARFELGDKSILYKVNDTIADMQGASSSSVSIA